MLGPPLPPSSSHLPPPSPLFSCSEWAPPPPPYPLTLPQTSPSTRDDWSSTCDLSMRNLLPRKTATIVDVQTPYYTPPPRLVSYTHCFSGEGGGGGTLRSLYLALIPICALKRQTVFPQTTTPPPLPFAPLSQEATRLSSISHATSYVVEMLILHNSVLFPTLKLFVFSAFWGSQSQIFRAKWIKQQN